MITAVDTNVLLDVLIPDTRFGRRSKALLDQALTQGSLVICEVVYAELAAQFGGRAELDRFLEETGIRLLPSSSEALWLASVAWRAYVRTRRARGAQCPSCGTWQIVHCSSCGEPIPIKAHILTDFLIGGHALAQADRFLTRDLGYYKTYFKGLTIVSPPADEG